MGDLGALNMLALSILLACLTPVSVLVSRITGHLRSNTHMDGKGVNQDLWLVSQ